MTFRENFGPGGAPVTRSSASAADTECMDLRRKLAEAEQQLAGIASQLQDARSDLNEALEALKRARHDANGGHQRTILAIDAEVTQTAKLANEHELAGEDAVAGALRRTGERFAAALSKSLGVPAPKIPRCA